MRRAGAIAGVVAVLMSGAAQASASITGNAKGDAVAVLRGNDNPDSRDPWALSVRSPGGRFSAPVTVTSRGAARPQVAVGADGTAVAVWSEGRTPNERVRAAVRPPGGSFGRPATLGEGGAFQPVAAVDGAGNAIVVWRRWRGPAQSADRPAAAGAFGPATDLPEPLSPKGVTFRPDGSVLLAAIQGTDTGGEAAVVSSLRRAGAARFDAAQPIARASATSEVLLRSNARGDAAVLFVAGGVIQAARRPVDADSFGPPLPVVADPEAAQRSMKCLSSAPRDAALGADGELLVLWRSVEPSDDDECNGAEKLWLAAAGAPAPRDLTDAALPPQGAGLAMNDRGDAVVVWGHRNHGVKAVRRLAGGDFAAPVQLRGPGLGGEPSVTLDDQGGATALWQENDGERIRTVALPVTEAPGAAPATLLVRRAYARVKLAAGRRACRPRRTRTLVASREARVYADLRSRQRPVFGCSFLRGRRVALEFGFGDFPRRVDGPPAMALAGPLVAFSYFDEECATCGGINGIAVVDLRTGRRANGWAPAGDPEVETHDGPSIERMVLRPTAGVAWTDCGGTSARACRRAGAPTRVFKQDSGAPAPERLAAGRDIDPRSLRLRGGRLSWVQGGQRRVATLR